MSTYEVVEGTQVNLAGVVLGEGSTFEADPALASEWVAGGLVIEVEVEAKAKRSRTKLADVPAIK